ncbi:MAG TPA: hypothetical protein VN372_03645 [Methanospirillum sp.]|nr:hypothetical protein [Methanospirillum sp.]
MRIGYLIKLVCILAVLILLVSIIAEASYNRHSSSLLIPTKYRFMLNEMAGPNSTPLVVASAPPTSPVRVGPVVTRIPEPVSTRVSYAATQSGTPFVGDDETAPLGSPVPFQFPYSDDDSLGVGSVQTNFDVYIEEPGRIIENREKYSARGLFDFHAFHEYTG